jgi:HK97 family phage prohead protease
MQLRRLSKEQTVKMDRKTANDLADVMAALARSDRRVKTAAATLKTAPTDGSGIFTAIVSTFDREPDTQGDVIGPQAFDRTIEEWRLNDRDLPIYWNHMYSDPGNAIGIVTSMHAVGHGLLVEGKLDLENGRAQKVYEGMLFGSIAEFSIAYSVIAEHREEIPPYGEVNVLDEVALLEVSVVTAGANRHTQLLDVKSITAGSTAEVNFEDSDPRRYEAILDSLEKSMQHVASDGVDLVDAFIAEDRALRIRERHERERVRHAAGDMNVVVNPMPVRVDSRMRLIEDPTPR